MRPIVNGLKEQYRGCLTVEEINFHAQSELRDRLDPFGTPEFALLDEAGAVLHRWFGFTEAEEFAAVLDPLCGEAT